MKQKNLAIISVGGSLIVPDEINLSFLKSFRSLIDRQTRKRKKFIVVCGGGKTCRRYQKAASLFSRNQREIDWLGIKASVLNAYLVKIVFGNLAHPKIMQDPLKKINFKEKVLVAAGFKPGHSTDYDAVLLANNFGAERVLNLTDINYVYDKDPDKYKNAHPIKKISWTDFRKLLPRKWKPGLNTPFDPIASKKAEKLGLEVVILNGKRIKQVENCLIGKDFIGTKIANL